MSNLKGNKTGGGIDPNFLRYLSGIAGGNQQRMQRTYQDLGLDTSGEAMGMSPQESKDLSWLQQGAEGTATQGGLQNSPTQLAAGNLSLNQLAAGQQQQSTSGTLAGLT